MNYSCSIARNHASQEIYDCISINQMITLPGSACVWADQDQRVCDQMILLATLTTTSRIILTQWWNLGVHTQELGSVIYKVAQEVVKIHCKGCLCHMITHPWSFLNFKGFICTSGFLMSYTMPMRERGCMPGNQALSTFMLITSTHKISRTWISPGP